MSSTYDVAIIGGGIIGLATAMALVEAHGIRLAVLEAEDRLAAHQTGHNSGVIHSGLYYKPGSLKAANCVSGREAMVQFCAQHDIAYERCGKLVVAVSPAELPALDELERRGRANGLAGLRRLAAGEIAEYEPHAAGVAALHVPETGIVDYTGVSIAMAGAVRAAGGEVCTGVRVTGCRRMPGELVLATSAGDVRCKALVNCGGLWSDRIACLCGVAPGLKIIPFRGEYHELIPARRQLVRNLIYPVPDPRFPFLGVHFTRMLHGGVETGPNAVLALKRAGYGTLSFNPRDTWELLTYPGTWRMARRYWRTGVGEVYRQWSKPAMVRALQAMVPAVQAADLQRAGAGVRAQAVEPSGRLVDDFRIVEAEHMIHVLNAPSPGATASISIGRLIAGLAVRRFELA